MQRVVVPFVYMRDLASHARRDGVRGGDGVGNEDGFALALEDGGFGGDDGRVPGYDVVEAGSKRLWCVSLSMSSK